MPQASGKDRDSHAVKIEWLERELNEMKREVEKLKRSDVVAANLLMILRDNSSHFVQSQIEEMLQQARARYAGQDL